MVDETQEAPADEAEAPADEGAEAPAADKTLNMVERVERAAKTNTEAVKRFEQLVKRQEEATARMMMSGQTNAGAPIKSIEEQQEDAINTAVNDALSRFKMPR